jgi:hypothetical protein
MYQSVEFDILTEMMGRLDICDRRLRGTIL